MDAFFKYASIYHSDIHQMKGHWGPQHYPQVTGHEIVGIVMAVGKNVTKFKVGDRTGVGCMGDSCLECEDGEHDEEQYCPENVFTYGSPQKSSPTGISQGSWRKRKRSPGRAPWCLGSVQKQPKQGGSGAQSTGGVGGFRCAHPPYGMFMLFLNSPLGP